MSPPATLIRARVYHTPRNPFEHEDALESFDDGALVFDGEGRILAVGDYPALAPDHPDAELHDARGALLLPGSWTPTSTGPSSG